ncbi:hypothetical protein C823_002175 [Eubacterium plexicaudatum ASF492]|uniref:HTH deoR-type domain-containing protein n=1 Tax=Eubacterium plexicaudatum ASF492 TaxID=1235802 RepID=N2BM52_9FIRM|nr:hypothetical protein C823_002175 [Eubacterium plexicaudatum ASF492]
MFKILYYLLDKGTVTAPELAKKFEVSVRTIYRDIDMLSGAGIPVYITTGHGGGIHLFDNQACYYSAPGGARFQQVKVLNPPGSGVATHFA